VSIKAHMHKKTRSCDVLHVLHGSMPDLKDHIDTVLPYPEFHTARCGSDRKESPADTLPWCETLVVVDASKAPEYRKPASQPFLELA